MQPVSRRAKAAKRADPAAPRQPSQAGPQESAGPGGAVGPTRPAGPSMEQKPGDKDYTYPAAGPARLKMILLNQCFSEAQAEGIAMSFGNAQWAWGNMGSLMSFLFMRQVPQHLAIPVAMEYFGQPPSQPGMGFPSRGMPGMGMGMPGMGGPGIGFPGMGGWPGLTEPCARPGAPIRIAPQCPSCLPPTCPVTAPMCTAPLCPSCQGPGCPHGALAA